ncbi:MAG: hypothetical protein K2F83_06340 [Oscillospiraceae bacterium]|nr:hypothetical protein [Oscillospiraceae bacterium]
MPANRNRTTYSARQTSTLSQLSPCAPLTVEDLTNQEEPMRRYPHPIPMCADATPVTSDDCTPCMNRVLEQLSCQSQLLVDLLGAVNSLTAALLAREDKT